MANSTYYGLRGNEALEWQKKLNALGAGLKEDGIWGAKTEAAYQKYGSQLGGMNTTLPVNKAPIPSYGMQPVYQQSQALKDAASNMSQFEQTRPGEYQSQYGDQIQGLLDQIMNRKDFKYDFSADPMYQQYKDRFQQQGKMAMMDTMGQAAALSGGYGNSYAQTAGQQAYQGSLGQMNDVIPALQQAAYQRYSDEGARMNNNLGLLQGMDARDYGMHRDKVGDWNTQYGQMMDKINNMSDDEWRQFVQQYAAWESDRNFGFNKEQAALDEKWRQTEWDYKLEQDKKNSSGSSSKKKSKTPSASDIYSQAIKTSDEIRKATQGWGGSGYSTTPKKNTKKFW